MLIGFSRIPQLNHDFQPILHPSENSVLDAMERMGGHKILDSQEGNPASATAVEVYLVSADGLEPSTHALKGVA